MKKPRNILITGASSGIGAALALEYAQQAHLLVLVGRSEERLKQVAAECGEKARVEIKIADVADAGAMEKIIGNMENLDLVIANAGISAGDDNNMTREIFAVNIGGVLNTVLPAVEKMKAQGNGQIVIIASVAGIRGLPGAPAYSASKACVLAYGQALRGSLQEFGINVSTVCPGYIKTPMTDKNNFYMPFLMSAEKAARIIVRGVEKNKSLIAFPLIMYALLKFLAFMPVIITDKIFGALPRK